MTFFSCSADTSAVQENQSTEATASEIIAERAESTGSNTDSQQESSTSKKTSASSVTSTSLHKAQSSAGNENNDAAPTTAASTSTKKQAYPSSAAKPPVTTQKQTTTSSTITCTVTVECKSVLDNMDNLKAGHETYVPSDGYILNSCCVTVANGSSAYDAVKNACDSNNIYLNTVSSSYGKYIAGINNIDEKDCGSQSGWLYNVNGTYPSKSCDRYVLSNGDNVVFTYTCS